MTGSMVQNVVETAMNITTNATITEAIIEVVSEAAQEVADAEDGMTETDSKKVERETGTSHKEIDEVDPEVHPVIDLGEAEGMSDRTVLLEDRPYLTCRRPRHMAVEDDKARLITTRTNSVEISVLNHRSNRNPRLKLKQWQLNHRHLPAQHQDHSPKKRRRKNSRLIRQWRVHPRRLAMGSQKWASKRNLRDLTRVWTRLIWQALIRPIHRRGKPLEKHGPYRMALPLRRRTSCSMLCLAV